MSQDNDSQSESIQPDLMDKLVAEMQGGRRTQATYRLVHDLDNWPLPSLDRILGVQAEDLTKRATDILRFFEGRARSEKRFAEWQDFKWKVTAFIEIQDVFGTPIYPASSILNLFHFWYLYFESRNLLVESVLCGLHGSYAASDAVLRPFLEFSVLQLYYRNVCDASSSFEPLENYFRTGRKPSWNTALKKALPDDAFCRPIKRRLDLHFKSLSHSATHPYTPEFSPRQHSTSPAQPSLEGIYFWYRTRLMLQAVLWAYYVNFPLLFSPRDLLSKFGFGGPVGLFADRQCGTAVKKSLGDAEYLEFLRYAENHDDVKSFLSWYQEQPDLSEEEIATTWNTEHYGELKRVFPEGYAQQMAYIRALREAMALKKAEIEVDASEGDEILGLLSYDRWKTVYKRF